jgi:malate synthase
VSDVRVVGGPVDRDEGVATPSALDFVAGLQLPFGDRRDELLALRRERVRRVPTT